MIFFIILVEDRFFGYTKEVKCDYFDDGVQKYILTPHDVIFESQTLLGFENRYQFD